MSSNIYLTQTQIHELFKICELKTAEVKKLEIPSFGEVEQSANLPEFQQEACHFSSDSKKEDNYTTNPTNNTNRHPSQDSIFEIKDDTVRISKLEYENLKRDALCYQSLIKQNKEFKTNKSIVIQPNQQKLQLSFFQDNNKKMQRHIYDLLQNVKSIEHENQKYQDDILQLRLQIQDQLKIIQQGKIDQERLKISIIQKDEAYIKLKNNYDKIAKDLERSKNCKSAQRGSYLTTNPSNLSLKGLQKINLKNYCNQSLIVEKQS
ncbi:unnamed protein product (macronuclear) [Paramecium tetraurelia]|uniref:Uncharacterized protein n=1 Tax=Paramecium tetraurelia TaxID=5888 RepID=A0BLX2_PARTE|nr:uncharacterized protein GSPATT00030173001 [Paramecium tetraurelia]CAK59539.1 unnamed protein product [Paramecium tetraurelia]|eukprot:XP_001426937.1 hypothetical protein (macronuclear) [Paramecium tetraurelia strain d4-2]